MTELHQVQAGNIPNDINWGDYTLFYSKSKDENVEVFTSDKSKEVTVLKLLHGIFVIVLRFNVGNGLSIFKSMRVSYDGSWIELCMGGYDVPIVYHVSY